MRKKQNPILAFSLVELSIVILIIGILIVGITQSSILVAKTRLSSARSLSNSSPVTSIKDLVAWLDATNENAFPAGTDETGELIATWNDINPSSTTKYNATAYGTSTTQPRIIENGINGLLSVNFPLSSTQANMGYFTFSPDPIIQSEFTVFVVDQAMSSTDYIGYVLSCHAPNDSAGSCFYVGRQTTNYLFGVADRFTAGLYANITGVGTSYIPRIQTAKLSSSGMTLSIKDGTNVLNSTVGSNTQKLDSVSQQTIGGWGGATFGYVGYIGEIIVFNRALKDSEIADVENYLLKKWQI